MATNVTCLGPYFNNDIIKSAIESLEDGMYTMSFVHQKSDFLVRFVIIINDNGILVKNCLLYQKNWYNPDADELGIDQDNGDWEYAYCVSSLDQKYKATEFIVKELSELKVTVYHNIRRSNVRRVARRRNWCNNWIQCRYHAEIDFFKRCENNMVSLDQWSYFSELFIKIECIPEDEREENIDYIANVVGESNIEDFLC